MKRKNEFERFDSAMKKIISTSHAELQERLAQEKKNKKRPKPLAASRSLVVRAASDDSSLTHFRVRIASLATDESLIYFDFAALAATELCEGIRLHCEPDTVHHEPCGLLGDSEGPCDLIRANAVLAVGNHPYGYKPLFKQKRRILKDSPDLDGELPLGMLRLAFPQVASSDEADFPALAGRTSYTVRPAPRDHEPDAILWIREVSNGLLQCLGLCHVRPHSPNTTTCGLLS